LRDSRNGHPPATSRRLGLSILFARFWILEREKEKFPELAFNSLREILHAHVVLVNKQRVFQFSSRDSVDPRWSYFAQNPLSILFARFK